MGTPVKDRAARVPSGISNHPAETFLVEDVDGAMDVWRKFLEKLTVTM